MVKKSTTGGGNSRKTYNLNSGGFRSVTRDKSGKAISTTITTRDGKFSTAFKGDVDGHRW